MTGGEETADAERDRALELAHAFVEEAWNLGGGAMTLRVEYEGALWEVAAKVIETEGQAPGPQST